MITGVFLLGSGCAAPKSGGTAAESSTQAAEREETPKPETKPDATKTAVADKPAEPKKTSASEKPADKPREARKADTKREAITAANNPTTAGGRGAPDLEKTQAPAAWIYVDGKSGKFKEEGGQPLLQWFIDEPVCATPTFRAEAFEPLLGVPKDFKAVLRTVESEDGSDLVYGIAANDGTFVLGKEYTLLSPGENFMIRNGATGDIIKEIAPLPPGKYAIAGAVSNTSTGKQALAVTYFTVKSDEK